MTYQQYLEARLLKIVPQEWIDPKAKTFWFSSSTQLATLFYDVFGWPVQRHKKTKQPTTDDSALQKLKGLFPELQLLFELLEEYRSVGVFLSNFILAPLDPDKRMRCEFKTTGTETFRWSSASNAFRRGTNLQNIPKGEEK